MSPRRATIAVALALGLGVAGVAVEWIATGGDPRLDAAFDLLAGWVIGGSGVIAWLLVPRSRIGLLLVAAAVAWFVGTLVAPGSPVARSDAGRLAGFLVQGHAAFLVHAIATWPSGRITRPTQLALVAGGYITALFPQVWYQSPGYLVLGALLAAGIALDHRALAPGRRDAYRPARAAGMLMAAGLALVPGTAQAFGELGWEVLASGVRLWAMLVAAVAVLLSLTLVARERRGAVADLAVRLHGTDGTGSPDDLARLLRDATGAEAADDPVVRAALERAVGLAERNRALRTALAAQVAELEASRRRLVEAGDAERRALRDRLRRGAGSRLAGLERTLADLTMATGPSSTPGDVTDPVRGRLERAALLLARAQDDLDALALGLDPGRVTERGLHAALQDLAATSPVPVEVSLPDRGPVESSSGTSLYFVASEALANVVRHAHARRAWLQLRPGPAGWHLLVEDDGVGGADPTAGSGLRGLQERLQALGGGLQVGPRHGGGTRLVATVPVARVGDAP